MEQNIQQIIEQEEIWRLIPLKELAHSYEVSSMGRVRLNGEIKKCHNSSNGYRGISLKTNTGNKNFRVHRLVGFAFIPNPHKKPHINHLNAIVHDNRLCNLEWCTTRENALHALSMGLMNTPKGEQSGNVRMTESKVWEIKWYIECGLTNRQISEMIKDTRQMVAHIRRGRSWAWL